MTDTLIARRRSSLSGLLFMPILLLIAAAAWTAFWFYAASKAEETLDGWRAREAKSGRIYDCANRSVGGFPFRLEVRCNGVNVALAMQTPGQAASRTPIAANLTEIRVVAQIYDPTRVIAEFSAPLMLAEQGQQPSLTMNWTRARSSVAGLPDFPQRISFELDDAAIDGLAGTLATPFMRAKHLELHGRLVEGSAIDNPVIETALQIASGALPGLHPLTATPFDADIRAKLRGLKDFSPKPWPERFREIQAAGGRIEITQSRIQQGELISVAAGSLGINANGRLDGELQMTVAGIEKLIPALGLDKMLAEGALGDPAQLGVNGRGINNVIGKLDRIVPGLGQLARQNANVGVNLGIAMLGQPATLEGKKAQSFPLRFVDGAVLIGPLKVGQIPPLF